MIERLTDRSRQVMALASEEASLLEHSSVRTEHILLGLVRETEGIGGRVLRSLGIVLEPLRRKVQVAARRRDPASLEPSAAKDQIQAVLTQALQEAFDLGHSFIGTEHILLALVAENERESVAVQVIVDLGTNREQVRARVARALSGLDIMEPAIEQSPNSVKVAADSIAMQFQIESPVEDVTGNGPGLYDANEICEGITTTFDLGPFTPELSPRRGGDRETLGVGTAEAWRRFRMEAEALLTRVQFLDADVADVECTVRYRSRPTRSVVGRVTRNEGWVLSPDFIRQVLRGAGIDLPPDL